jgi:hypothetical protein
MIMVRLRASGAVFHCESCGAMSRGLIDMLDNRTSQASNLRQSVEIKGCHGEGELPVELWAARDAASCLTRHLLGPTEGLLDAFADMAGRPRSRDGGWCGG